MQSIRRWMIFSGVCAVLALCGHTYVFVSKVFCEESALPKVEKQDAVRVTGSSSSDIQIGSAGVLNLASTTITLLSVCTDNKELRPAIGFTVCIEAQYLRVNDVILIQNELFCVYNVKEKDTKIMCQLQSGRVIEKTPSGFVQIAKIATYEPKAAVIILFPYHCVLGR